MNYDGRIEEKEKEIVKEIVKEIKDSIFFDLIEKRLEILENAGVFYFDVTLSLDKLALNLCKEIYLCDLLVLTPDDSKEMNAWLCENRFGAKVVPSQPLPLPPIGAIGAIGAGKAKDVEEDEVLTLEDQVLTLEDEVLTPLSGEDEVETKFSLHFAEQNVQKPTSFAFPAPIAPIAPIGGRGRGWEGTTIGGTGSRRSKMSQEEPLKMPTEVDFLTLAFCWPGSSIPQTGARVVGKAQYSSGFKAIKALFHRSLLKNEQLKEAKELHEFSKTLQEVLLSCKSFPYFDELTPKYLRLLDKLNEITLKLRNINEAFDLEALSYIPFLIHLTEMYSNIKRFEEGCESYALEDISDTTVINSHMKNPDTEIFFDWSCNATEKKDVDASFINWPDLSLPYQTTLETGEPLYGYTYTMMNRYYMLLDLGKNTLERVMVLFYEWKKAFQDHKDLIEKEDKSEPLRSVIENVEKHVEYTQNMAMKLEETLSYWDTWLIVIQCFIISIPTQTK